MIAMDRIENLSLEEKDLADEQIKQIISLKYQMETTANKKGYSQACKSSIPICKGDCCKWHFPQNLNHIDFFISIFYMSKDQRSTFTELLLNNQKNRCPILLKTGCFLTFEQRPILCTNAYPCFSDRSYWVEKERKNIQFRKAVDLLNAVFT